MIKSMTESMAGNRITRVMGVMNGTCNYILTRMESAGLASQRQRPSRFLPPARARAPAFG